MKVINVRVTDKVQLMGIKEGDSILNANFPLKLAEGNYKSVIMNFEFASSTWTEKELTKYATFKINGFKKVQVELETLNGYSNACYVPYDVFKENCKVEVGVYGIAKSGGNAEKIVSTEVIKMLVVDGSYNEKLREENDIPSSNAERLEEQINELTILLNDKADKKSIPVKVSDLENDEKFIKNTVDSLANYYLKAEIYTKDEVKNLINAIKTIQMEVVTVLPATGENNIIYLIARNEQENNNIYDEYIYVNEIWEKIGSTDVDLTNYALKSELPIKLSQLQNDSGFINAETDPTVPSHVKTISQTDISNWNNKSNFDGDYTELANKPTINNVELDGNKTLSDLGIDIPNLPDLIKNAKNFPKSKVDISAIDDGLYIGQDTSGTLAFSGISNKIIISEGSLLYIKTILNRRYGIVLSLPDTIYGNPITKNIIFHNFTGGWYIAEFNLNEALSKNNTSYYTVSSDYNPAHKKYVDDTIKSKINTTFTLDGTTLYINIEE